MQLSKLMKENLEKAEEQELTSSNNLLLQVGNALKSLPADKVAKAGDVYIPNLAYFEKCGKNIFDGSVLDGDKYIYPTNGRIENAAYPLHVTKPIPVDLRKTHVCWSSSNGSNCFGPSLNYRFLNENMGIISFGKTAESSSSSGSVAIPSRAVFLQFTYNYSYLGSGKLQVEFGESATSFEKYKGLVTEDVIGTPITNSGKVFADVCGKNLFNQLLLDGKKYVNPSNGNVVDTDYELKTTVLIPIDATKEKITLSSSNSSTCFLSSNGYRFIDNNKNVISYGKLVESGRQNKITLSVPASASFVQFSFSKNSLGNGKIQVEHGSTATSFENFNGVVTVDYLNDVSSLSHYKVFLPQEIPFIKNVKSVIYFDNIVDNSNFEKLPIRFDNSNQIVNRCNVGAVAKVSADSEIEVNVYKNLKKLLLGKFTAKVVNPSAITSTAKIMALGDSWTETGVYLDALNSDLTRDGITHEFIGAMHSNRAEGTSSENQTGGTLWRNFLQPVSGSCFVVDVVGYTGGTNQNYGNYVNVSCGGNSWIVWGSKLDGNGNGKLRLYNETSGKTLPSSGSITTIGSANLGSFSNPVAVNKNPFWNPSTSSVDVDYYFNLWGFELPTTLIIQFMWNDFTDGQTDFSFFIGNLNTFLSKWFTKIPTLKVIVSTESSNPMNGTKDDSRKLTVLKFFEALVNNFKNESRVFVCPTFAFIDREYGFGSNELVLSERVPARVLNVANDDIHPSVGGGYLQCGDVIAQYVEYSML